MFKIQLFLTTSILWTQIIKSGNSMLIHNSDQNYQELTAINENIESNHMLSRNVGQLEELQKKWKKILVSDTFESTRPVIVQYVKTLSQQAEVLYRELMGNKNQTYLWKPEAGDSPSAQFSTAFSKLLKLTLAYGTNGTKFYKDARVISTIKDALNFMVRKGYNGQIYHNNWWDWQIGVPLNLVGIMMVLNDELSIAEKEIYLSAIDGYVPNPFYQLHNGRPGHRFFYLTFLPKKTSGANRMHLAQIILGLGILQNNHTKVNEAINSIRVLFDHVTYGDGFYIDGSFIQHSNIPYTAAYGGDLLKSICIFLMIIKDSRYDVEKELVQTFVERMQKAFIPLIYIGELLPIVLGRTISREPTVNRTLPGVVLILFPLLLLSEVASEESSKNIKEAVKYWMQENPNYYLSNVRNYNELIMSVSLLEDDSILGNRIPFLGTYMYFSMNRFVQRTRNYMVGLSMYSNRISAFEAGNKENKRGWHTADGMLYLYNDDEVQFNKTYWPTVDPYRLPGTTVDTERLADEITFFRSYLSKERWVGGVSSGHQAVVGMSLNKAGFKNNNDLSYMNLRAKKSWFFVDGKIVALGAGITGDTRATIETVVENRLLKQ